MRRFIFVFLIFSVSVSYAQKKLIGKTWKVIAMQDYVLSDSCEFPLLKLEKDRISGYSSCNRIIGEYSIQKKQISFQNLGGTKMLCPEPAYSREKLFFETLELVDSWKIKKKKLFLLEKHSQCVMVLEENKE